MEFSEIVSRRRAYRALEPVKINEEIVRELAETAGMSPSCFNNQPWRYVFVFGEKALEKVKEALARGNAWAQKASMIIGVYSRKDLDCDIKGREYFLFDTGMATAFLQLKATEMGLVAHPIAGFKEELAKEAMGIDPEMRLITLVIVGKHASNPGEHLEGNNLERELSRPPRKKWNEFAFIDRVRD